ncbi:unnamed protein product, partial [Protopolystoma xenopodis]
MSSSCDDALRRMNDSAVRFHQKRGKTSRGPRQPYGRIEAKRLRYNTIHPSSSSSSSSSSSCTFMRNQRAPNN